MPSRGHPKFSIVVSIALVVFNAMGLASYQGFYDKGLLVIRFLVNGVIVWIAWFWQLHTA